MVKYKYFISLAIVILQLVVGDVILGAEVKYSNEQVIEFANREITDKYGLYNYFTFQSLNKLVFSNKETPSYGDPFGTIANQGITRTGQREHRYIGFNKIDEAIPNRDYPYDQPPTSDFDVKNWIINPWSNESVERNFQVKENFFDAYRLDFLPNFIHGMQTYHGAYFRNTPGIPWETYYHIVVPSTEYTYGSARLFFWNDYNQLRYIDVALSPGYMVPKDLEITVSHRLENETPLQGHDYKLAIKEHQDYQVDAKSIVGYTCVGSKISIDSGGFGALEPIYARSGRHELGNKTIDIIFYYQPEAANPIIYEAPGSTGGTLRLASMPRGAESYDVAKGVPSHTKLFANILVDEHISSYSAQQVRGSQSVDVEITGSWLEIDGSTTAFTETRTVSRSYTYWQVTDFYFYGIASAQVSNSVLGNQPITITPKGYTVSGKIEKGGVTSSLSDTVIDVGEIERRTPLQPFAEAEIGSIGTSDDRLVINGQTITIGESLPTPKKIGAEVLYLQELLIPKTQANQKQLPTTGQVIYQLLAHEGAPQPSTRTFDLTGNPITVHTPVVCFPTINKPMTDSQRLSPASGRIQLQLGDTFVVNYPNSGQHLNQRGYGNRDYSEFIGQKQIQFTFDVYEGRDDKGKWIPKGTWVNYPATQQAPGTMSLAQEATYYIPPFSGEQEQGQVLFRTVAINTPNIDTSGHESQANLNLDNYKATASINVQVSGRLYDFRMIGSSDPNWSQFFQPKTGGQLSAGSTLLPLMPGKNQAKGYESYGLKLGYSFNYTLKTNGGYYHGDDFVYVVPKYYHVDEMYQNRQEVDVYYESTLGFIRLGSAKDTLKRSMVLSQTVGSILEQAWRDTAQVLVAQNRGNGYNESKYLELLKGNNDLAIGHGGQWLLGERQKLYTGRTTTRPSSYTEAQILQSEQQWYGKFYLPNQAVFVPKGTDLSKLQGLSAKKEPFIQKGYIIIQFEVYTLRDVTATQLESLKSSAQPSAYLNTLARGAYKVTGQRDQWLREGFNPQQVGTTMMSGDVMLYHVDKRASEDYK